MDDILKSFVLINKWFLFNIRAGSNGQFTSCPSYSNGCTLENLIAATSDVCGKFARLLVY